MSDSTPTLADRLRPALKLLPIECHDTPDYAEVIGEQFQAMTMLPDAFLALNSLPDAIAALDASGNDELEWLDAHKSMELTWGELDGDMSECAWRVHRVNGGYNDREWTLIATGETALEAIRAAITRTQEQSDG